MELHAKISYYITSHLFRDLNHVEHWHGNITPKYATFDTFQTAFEATFGGNKRKFLNEHANLFCVYCFSSEDADRAMNSQEYEDEFEQLCNVLYDFYPILRCTIPGSESQSPVDKVMHNVIHPWLLDLPWIEIGDNFYENDANVSDGDASDDEVSGEEKLDDNWMTGAIVELQ